MYLYHYTPSSERDGSFLGIRGEQSRSNFSFEPLVPRALLVATITDCPIANARLLNWH